MCLISRRQDFPPVVNKIIEIGAVRVENGAIVDKFSTFVNPKVPIPFRIENLTGINDNMVLDAPDIETVLPKFLEFSEGAVMVAHNASFDMSFIEHNCVLQGIEREFTTADTVAMARFLLPRASTVSSWIPLRRRSAYRWKTITVRWTMPAVRRKFS